MGAQAVGRAGALCMHAHVAQAVRSLAAGRGCLAAEFGKP